MTNYSYARQPTTIDINSSASPYKRANKYLYNTECCAHLTTTVIEAHKINMVTVQLLETIDLPDSINQKKLLVSVGTANLEKIVWARPD